MSDSKRKSDTDSHHYQNGHGGTNMYDAWRDFYTNMAEEGMGFFNHSVEMAQKMMPVYGNSEAFKTWVENYQDFVSRMAPDADFRASNATDMYKKFYDSWMDIWSRNLESYMRTPEFAAKSGKDLETFSEFRTKMNQMMESYWEAINLPSTADMRELYHKLYIMERKLDDMDARIRKVIELMETAAASSATPKTGTTKSPRSKQS